MRRPWFLIWDQTLLPLPATTFIDTLIARIEWRLLHWHVQDYHVPLGGERGVAWDAVFTP
jgi:hypothetical protein